MEAEFNDAQFIGGDYAAMGSRKRMELHERTIKYGTAEKSSSLLLCRFWDVVPLLKPTI